MQRDSTIHHQDGMNPSEIPISSGNLDNVAATMQLASSNKRDSGYGTEVNSPASQTSGTSAPRRFTYGSLQEEFQTMDLNEHNEVFSDSVDVMNADRFDDDDGDDTDKEVEDLLSDSIETNHSVSQPIDIQRPQAPIPTPEEDREDDTIVKFTIGEDYDDRISRPIHHTHWNRLDRQRNRFRPIASRSFGTQTPSPDGIGSLPTRRPIRPTSARGRGLSRLRLRSESEMTEGSSPLPDVVPFPRDRSVSLPEVPAYRVQEREVGRELRRISDEFLSSFTPIQQRNGHPSSFPMRVNINVHAYFNRIRRIVSSSSMTPEVNDQPFKFPPNK